jgi:hypothetical protein
MRWTRRIVSMKNLLPDASTSRPLCPNFPREPAEDFLAQAIHEDFCAYLDGTDSDRSGGDFVRFNRRRRIHRRQPRAQRRCPPVPAPCRGGIHNHRAVSRDTRFQVEDLAWRVAPRYGYP